MKGLRFLAAGEQLSGWVNADLGREVYTRAVGRVPRER